jgi:hypothetical protein
MEFENGLGIIEQNIGVQYETFHVYLSLAVGYKSAKSFSGRKESRDANKGLSGTELLAYASRRQIRFTMVESARRNISISCPELK